MKSIGFTKPSLDEIGELPKEFVDTGIEETKNLVKFFALGILGLLTLGLFGEKEHNPEDVALEKQKQHMYYQRVKNEEQYEIEKLKAEDEQRVQEQINQQRKKLAEEQRKNQQIVSVPRGKTTKPGSAFVGMKTNKQSTDQLVQKG